VAGFRPAPDGGGHPDFAPGASVELMPADDDSRRINVWNPGMTARAGHLPDAAAARLEAAGDDVAGEALVLWEWRQGGQRTGLRLLLVRADMELD
jgi:hypothetical protein